MADVGKLLQSGNRDFAIRCYREITKAGFREAIKEVDAMAATGTPG
jgi:hypothetical protein